MSSQMHSVNKSIGIENGALEASIAAATRALLGYRKPDGHWVFELEADSTIPAEYVLLRHYLGEPVDAVLEAKIANYLRRVQGAHGGWPLVHEGALEMSASVKSYFALKMIGDPIDAPHMVRAREAILAHGRAIHSNVFTRFMPAMFRALDSVLRVIEPLFPKKLRARAIDAAVAFIEQRLNGEDGLGAIYPPMANTVMMYEVLGKPADYPPRAATRRGLDNLLVIGEHDAYCQPCVSPVLDTSLACHALIEAGGEEACAPANQGRDWLKPKQVLDIKG